MSKSDIVERLSSAIGDENENFSLRLEAADTITSLRGEVARLNMLVDRLNRTNNAKREHRDKLLAEVERLRAGLDGAYNERNRLVAFLARLFPSGLKTTAIPGWDEAWHNCVYIDLPSGQASWHFHDREAHLFGGLPPYAGEWDGHSTEEKYERIARSLLTQQGEG